jgi:hypothetical protein
MPRREGEVLRLGTAIFRTPANQAATGGLAERERKREARLLHANARERQPGTEQAEASVRDFGLRRLNRLQFTSISRDAHVLSAEGRRCLLNFRKI